MADKSRNLAIGVILPDRFQGDTASVAIRLIHDQIEGSDIDVVDTGIRYHLASAEPPLRFVLELAQHWGALSAAAYVGGKTIDVAVEMVVKPVIKSLAGVGGRGVSKIWRALKRQYGETRQVQLEAQVTVEGVTYEYALPGIEEVDEAVLAIPGDLTGSSIDKRRAQRFWKAGRWMGLDDALAYGREERRNRRERPEP